jgi:hypothetical protein
MFNARYTKCNQSTERTSDDTSTDEERYSLGDLPLQVPDGEEEGHGLTEHCFTDTDEETAHVESRTKNKSAMKFRIDGESAYPAGFFVAA